MLSAKRKGMAAAHRAGNQRTRLPPASTAFPRRHADGDWPGRKEPGVFLLLPLRQESFNIHGKDWLMVRAGKTLRRAVAAIALGFTGWAGVAVPAQAQYDVVPFPLAEPVYAQPLAHPAAPVIAPVGYHANDLLRTTDAVQGGCGYAAPACAPACPPCAAPAAACGSCDACTPCVPCYAGPRCRDPWYVSLSGGWAHREDVHEVTDPNTFLTFDEGFAVNVALGHRFNLFRVEAEYSFFNQEIDIAGTNTPLLGLGIGPSPASGNVNLRAIMFNIYHDLDLPFTVWRPYLGAGLGTYQSDINSLYPAWFDVAGAPFAGQTINTTSDFAFAYQFRAGASRSLGERTEFYTGYRFFKGEDLTFSSIPFAGFAPTFNPDGAEVHSLETGLRIRF
jgi:hypothetical protein